MNDPNMISDRFENEHLAVLMECLEEGENRTATEFSSPAKWAEDIGQLIDGLSSEAESREALLAAFADSPLDIRLAVLRILAWGEMRKPNAKVFFRAPTDCYKLCCKISAGKYTRSESYEQFRKLRSEGKLKGMGPAYFTKLIYFLMPKGNAERPTGYILDQWVGSSVNLLLKESIVKMGSNFIVSDLNTGEIYEAYCGVIEELASRLNLDPDVMEVRLMSIGQRKGQRRARWRSHVRANRKANP